MQFGLLSSHSRLHGSDTYRVPWSFDDEASVVLSKFTLLKNRLEPYLTSLSIDAKNLGHSLLRATFLEYPEDPICWTLDTQYMLGGDLLVAPVFALERVQFYLPEGSWTNVLTGKSYRGGRYYIENHSMLTLPLLLRPESGVILGRKGHRVTSSLKTEGFSLVISDQIEKPFSVAIKLRTGAKISCRVEPDLERPGRESAKKIKVVIETDLTPVPAWEVVVIGSGVGLDSDDIESRTFRGDAKGVCDIVL